MTHELRDVTPGLWLWRLEHPAWAPDVEWEPLVTSTCAESSGEVALLNPLAPPPAAREIWERLDARRRRWPSSSSRITFATSTSWSAATAPVPSAPASSGPATSRRPAWKGI